ncbi:MAG: c-type cytochrome [Bacteroidales bacterium]
MKNITSIMLLIGSFSLVSCQDNRTFSPERLFNAHDPQGILVSDRSNRELLWLSDNLKDIKGKITFQEPVQDVVCENGQRIWTLCDGTDGTLYELNGADLSIVSAVNTGAYPSSMVFNKLTNTIWITHRFQNAMSEVNPVSKQIKTYGEVGREPVDVVTFRSDSLLLIANNMPEMSSLSYPLSALLTVFDVSANEVKKRISLPNGSTDVKEIAVDHKRNVAYVTHLLSRYQLPTNQVDRGWMCTNALSVIDLDREELLTTVLLDTPQKGSANPWGVTLCDETDQIVVAASGVHELVLIDRSALHKRFSDVKNGIKVTPSTRKWEDIPNDAGFLYGISRFVSTAGKGPRSVISKAGRIYAANYFTGEMIALDPQTLETLVVPAKGLPLTATTEGLGNMYFHDASIGFQGWQSCASCHPNEARVDGLNWDLLNDGMGNSKNTKTLLFSHQTAPCMVTGIRRDAETAVRSGLKYILFAQPNEAISLAMDAYLKSLKPLPSPYLVDGKLSAAAEKGKVIFDRDCASCHSGSFYTDYNQYDVNWTNGSETGVKMDVSALNEVWRTAPYLYDGRSYSMMDMLRIHGPKEAVSQQELSDLAEYVLSL